MVTEYILNKRAEYWVVIIQPDVFFRWWTWTQWTAIHNGTALWCSWRCMQIYQHISPGAFRCYRDFMNWRCSSYSIKQLWTGSRCFENHPHSRSVQTDLLTNSMLCSFLRIAILLLCWQAPLFWLYYLCSPNECKYMLLKLLGEVNKCVCDFYQINLIN